MTRHPAHPQAGSNMCVCGDLIAADVHTPDPAHITRDQWRSLAEDLWDELMAWHYDDCPFPDTPIGTTDDACICHADIKAKWDEVTARPDDEVPEVDYEGRYAAEAAEQLAWWRSQQ